MNKLIPYQKQSVTTRKPVKYITFEEYESFRRAVDIVFERSKHSENDQWIRDRDKLLLTLMWITGARISDVLAVRTEHIDFKDKTITFLVKKRKDKKRTDKQFWHTITLDLETLSVVMDYILTWSVKGFLFANHMHSDKQLSRQAVYYLLKDLASVIGFTKQIHPHMFRHGLAKFMQRKGAYVEMISFRLAHSGTDITLSTYAAMDSEQEKHMLEALNIDLSKP